MASITLPTRALTAALFTLLAWAVNPFTTQAQLPDYLPTDGLVGWWPFNGNANDESGNGNDGTVNGATLTEDREGDPNAAYSFDGVDDYIEIVNNPDFSFLLNSSYSINLWFNLNSMNNLNSFIGQGDGDAQHQNRFWRTYINQGQLNNHIRGNLTDPFDTKNQSSHSSINTWAMITMVRNYNNDLKLFIGGVLVDVDTDITGVANPFTNQRNIFIGAFLNAYTSQLMQFMNGKLDDIGIWNRTLTQQEITALYTGIPYVAPCADPTACNFEQEGECVYAEPNLDCAGNCLNDFNNNGVCDEVEVYGCEYPTACNYNPEANVGDGSCTFPAPNYDCAGNCLLDLNNNGMCDLEEAAGCTNVDAINYNADATLDDGSCMVTCKGDFDNDGQITINDLLGFLAAFGNQCEGAGCMDPAGCNYDPTATFDLGYCEYPAEFFNCEGAPLNDADGDGIPDELEVAGCTDPDAGNYNPEATDDNGSCTFGLTGSNHSCGAENVHNPDLVYGSVTDIDGNTYRTIVIGEQEWMAENLTVEHYANGDPIPNIEDQWEWELATSGALCNYLPVPLYHCPYGLLYNWYATVDSRNLCPTGWHVPTDTEWSNLIDYLDPNADVLNNENNAGGQMKSAGSQYWASPNDATNTSGFSGLPGGARDPAGLGFNNLGLWGAWWSSTGDIDANNNEYGLYRDIYYLYGNISRNGADKSTGYSVRCIKD